MAELVDAMDSKSISRKGVGVRVPSLVPAPLAHPNVRAGADELALVLLPALHGVLRDAARCFDRAAATPDAWADERRMRDVASRSRRCHQVGWCFGLLAAASGVDVLRARHEPDGLRAILVLLGDALDDRAIEPHPSELPRTRARAGWELAFVFAVVALRVSAHEASIAWRMTERDNRTTLCVRGRAPDLPRELLALVPGARAVRDERWFGLEFDTSLLERS